jgi:hypothetical protein
MTAAPPDNYMPHPEEARRAVSKGRHEHHACCPCFETLAALAPQHEVVA